MNKTELSLYIKENALNLGFYTCGIARATLLDFELNELQSRINSGYLADMNYLGNEQEKRCDPRLIHEKIKSVIAVSLNYFTGKKQHKDAFYHISKYAYGADYHNVVINLLNKLAEKIKNVAQPEIILPYSDTGPVMEKAWAHRAGLGTIGKNTLLISEKGSFYFLGILLTDLDLAYDLPLKQDLCIDCNRCVDACPTGTLITARTLDARNCIAYHTIENKGEIPEILRGKFHNNIFGCDICQDVCPWNRHQPITQIPDFAAEKPATQLLRYDWKNLTADTFSKLFLNSAIKRRKITGIQKNIAFISKNKPDAEASPLH
jgi:epoxyqueuosine reductase